MAYRILLLISLFFYIPIAEAGNTTPIHSASLKAFIDPNTGVFTHAPKKKIQPSARSIQTVPITKNTTPPTIINSPVKGGGKMVRVQGLFNSQFTVRKQSKGWQAQCSL